MKITKNVKTKSHVYHIEKVNDETLLIADEYIGFLLLINKKDMSWLSDL